ncbi:MAG: cadherin-like domain-containing protein [Hyphomicrobiaceae bacterium]
MIDDLVAFAHDDSETTTATFDVSVEDGDEDGSAPTPATFNLTVTPVNDPPVLAGDLAASVLEGGTVALTTADLDFVDPDDGPGDVTFTVSNQVNGVVLVNGLAATTFTGQDVIDDLVAFAHDGSNTTAAAFDVTVEDGDEDGSAPTPATFNLTVVAANDPPVLAGDLAATVAEGGTVIVTTADLDFVDPDDGPGDVTFTVSNQVNGAVLVNGLAATTFTGQDVIDDLVAFAHDDSETTTATFDVSVEDGDEDGSAPATSTFNIAVTPVNDPPVLAGDLAATVDEGGTVVLTTADLDFVDPDDGPGDVTFTVSNQVNGTVLLEGVAATTFTGQDVIDDLVAFEHDGSETTAATFDVSVEDGDEDGSAPTTVTFDLTVTPVNDPPVVTPIIDTIGEDGPAFSVDLLTGASDPDPGDTLSIDNPPSSITSSNGRVLTQGLHYTVVGSTFALTAAAFALFNSLAAGASDDFVIGYDVSDGTDSVPNTATITVTGDNDAPTVAVTIADQEVAPGAAINLDVSGAFADVDIGDTLTLSAQLPGGDPLPPWLNFNSATGVFTGTPPNSLASSPTPFEVEVIATDLEGATASQAFEISLTPTEVGDVTDDTLNGTAGSDYITGLAGDDTLVGSSGDDVLDGGDGDDTADYSFATNGIVVDLSADPQFGTATGADIGSDTLIGIENIIGGSGNDDITGDDGRNRLVGNDGDDRLEGGLGVNTYVGGAGDDTFVGGTRGFSNEFFGDFDIADYSDATSGITANLIGGLNSTDSSVTGDASVGTDTLTNIDSVVGSEFDDTFTAGPGHSSKSNSNFNEFEGQGGNDTLTGNGNTRASYRNASDSVTVDLSLTTGAAQSTNPGDTADIGVDTFVSGVNRIRGSDFDDFLFGSNSGNFESIRGAEGNDYIDGRGGSNDRADYRNSPNGITADLSVTVASTLVPTGPDVSLVQDGFGTTDEIVNMDRIRGSEFDDQITGGENIGLINGRGGDDVLTSVSSGNILRGGAGDDTLIGSGAIGNPGDQFNQVDYRDATDGVTIELGGGANANEGTAFSTNPDDSANIGVDTLVNPEFALGSAFDDIVTVNAAYTNRFDGFFDFEGGAGDDKIDVLSPDLFVRISFVDADAGVDVDMEAGTASSIIADDANIGNDTFSGIDAVRGSDFGDILRGRNSLTEGDQLRPRGGDDTVDGRGGLFDEARYTATDNDVIIDLGSDNQTTSVTTTSDGFGGTDTLINIENLRSGRGNDQLSGDINDNRLRGGDGNDKLIGRGGDDDLRGESGNDFLSGGSGDNVLQGGAGNDILQGAGSLTTFGIDFNRINYRDAADGVTIQIFGGTDTTVSFAQSTGANDAANIGFDSIANAEFAFGSDFVDFVFVSQDFDNRYDGFFEFEGGAGDDQFVGNGESFMRVAYTEASAAVTVDLGAGTAVSTGAGDAANIGLDTLVGVSQVRGSAFDDTLTGSASGAFQSYRGEAGNDTIDGVDGVNDRADYLSSPAGIVADLSTVDVNGSSQIQDGYGTTDDVRNIDQVRGSEFDDQITGDSSSNRLDGRSGNDVLAGLGGDDVIRGRDGNDDIDGGAGNDSIRGGAGDDTLDGGADTDFLDYSNAADNVVVDLGAGTASGADIGSDTVSNFEDVAGGFGNDSITGDSGTNFIFGNDGDDILIGGAGDDTLFGGFGFNTLIGGAGNDTLVGAGTINDFTADFNRVDYRDALAGVTIELRDGVDSATSMAASTGIGDPAGIGTDTLINAEYVVGSNFDDIITIEGSFDSRFGFGFVEVEGADGNDTINGNGATRLGYREAPVGVIVDLEAGTASAINPSVGDGVGSDTFTGISQVRGSSSDDQLFGSNGLLFESFRGQAGNDYIDGRGGTNDRADYRNSPDGIVVDLSVLVASTLVPTGPDVALIQDGFGFTDEVVNIERIRGSEHDDQITGDSINNRLDGRGGADVIAGLGGDDIVFGEDGNDILIGGAGTDFIDGGSGFDVADYSATTLGVTVNLDTGTATGSEIDSDTLVSIERAFGGSGNDILIGGAGDSLLRGGAGNDTLTGLASEVIPGSDFNRVDYRDAADDVTIQLGVNPLPANEGTAFSTNAGDTANIGTDTLINSEMAYGSDFDDTVVVDANYTNRFGGFFEFEGGAGDDSFTYNAAGTGRVSYRNAPQESGGVIVDLEAGTADAVNPGPSDGVGSDNFSGVNQVRGSDFDDTLLGRTVAGADQFRPRAGNDFIDGRGGLADEARYSSTDDAVVIDLGIDNQTIAVTTISDGFGGIDTLIGIENLRSGRGDDSLSGDINDNRLRGGDGDDALNGRAGDDLLLGEGGNDLIFGGAGNDQLEGGFGDNTLRGGAGNDTLIGENVVQNSSQDFNRVDYRDALDDVTIQMSGGIDSTTSKAFSTNAGDTANIGIDTLVNAEYVFGSHFNDTVTVAAGYENRFGFFFEFEGGAGDDTLEALSPDLFVRASYLNAVAGVEVDLQAETASSVNANDAGIGTDTLIGVDSVRGSDYDDILTGRDSLTEGDQLRPRAGDDTVDGGGGLFDEVRYSSTSNDVIIDLGSDNQSTAITTASDGFGGTDTLINIERIRSGGGNDQLSGDVNNNRLLGGSGDDTLDGRGGNDQLLGEAGNDLLIGGAGNDTLDGGGDFDTADYSATTSGVTVDLAVGTATGAEIGSDSLLGIESVIGGAGNDSLQGSAGSDTLIGGAGADTLAGLAGNDTIVLSVATFASVDGGADQDVLQLDGSLNLDFSALTGTIAGVEAIDLNSVGINTLSLSEDDVINLSGDANLEFTFTAADQIPGTPINTTENILVDGGSVDTVNLTSNGSGAWTDTGETVRTGGQDYAVYNYVDGASILASVAIDTEVTTNTS